MDATHLAERDDAQAVSEPLDPKAAARAARLRYVTDKKPGITRHRSGVSFCYRDPDGKLIRDKAVLKRIKNLAIPPAWQEVWICPFENGHIQAVGRDDRKRKQYRYHPRWREVRDEAKYGKMIAFGALLPKIRARVDEDLGRRGLPREKVLAAIVRLLETTLIRVGNEEYAKQNKSYGLTTLKDRHARIRGSRVVFKFKGKSGQEHEIDLADRRLARIVKQSQDLPGQELFQYLDEEGEVRDVRSDDVNDYLREISGEEDVTAKDFRTWAATNLAAIALQEFERVDSQARMKRNVRQAIEAVAKMLGNTPTVCRKCYVHPAIVDGYLDGTLAEVLKARAEQKLRDELQGLKPEEAAVMAFLQQRLGELAGR
jgi:DNA topoisomerase-1